LVLSVVITIMGGSGQWTRTWLVTILTLSAIYIMYRHRTTPEGFDLPPPIEGPAIDTITATGGILPPADEVFQSPSAQNPFSNVLIPDYELNPHKLPAPPITRPEVANEILQQAVNVVQEANPNFPGITDKLFRDVNDQLTFEQSMRPFTSNPSTTIPNDQGAFAQFCYGSMISCKEGNLFACARNTSHYTNN
jgi:hypothetical protein